MTRVMAVIWFVATMFLAMAVHAAVTVDRRLDALVAGYDGAAVETVYDGDYGADKVTLWLDQIGSYDLVKGSSSLARCPLLLDIDTGGGLHPVLYFGGSIQHMYHTGFNLALPNTFFIVMSSDGDTPPAGTVFDGKGNDGDYRNALGIDSGGSVVLNCGSDVVGDSLAIFANSFYVYCCEFQAGQSSVSVVWGRGPDGMLVVEQLANGDAGSDALKGLEIGCRWDAVSGTFFHGKIAELLVYDDVLAATDRDAVLVYLYDKYIDPPYVPVDEFNGPPLAWATTTNADATLLAKVADNGQVLGMMELYCHNKREPFKSQMQLDYAVGQDWLSLQPDHFRIRLEVLLFNEPGVFFVELSDESNTQTVSVFPSVGAAGQFVLEIPIDGFDLIDFGDIRRIAVGVDYGDVGGNGHFEIDYIRLYPKTCPNPMPADITGDCVIDMQDLTGLASHWLLSTSNMD